MFSKARKLSEYPAPASPVGEVALIYSGRTNDVIYGHTEPDGLAGYPPRRYYQNQPGLYQALLKAHIQVVPLWAETLTNKKLSIYPCAILSHRKRFP